MFSLFYRTNNPIPLCFCTRSKLLCFFMIFLSCLYFSARFIICYVLSALSILSTLFSSKVLSFWILNFTIITHRSHKIRFTSLTIFFPICMNSHVPQCWNHWMSQTPTVNHNFVLSPAGSRKYYLLFFSLDLNKKLVRFPTFSIRSSFLNVANKIDWTSRKLPTEMRSILLQLFYKEHI